MVMKPPPLTDAVPPPAAFEYVGCSPKVRTFAPIAEDGDVAVVAPVVVPPDPPAVVPVPVSFAPAKVERPFAPEAPVNPVRDVTPVLVARALVAWAVVDWANLGRERGREKWPRPENP
jgi:hypothetical protein